MLLDGAQGVGAVPVDVHALGCDAYAGAGQKWLCGPDGTGMLWVSPALRERLSVSSRGYANLADPNEGLDAQLHEDARRFDTMSLSAETTACALAARSAAGVRRLGRRARARAHARRTPGGAAGRAGHRASAPRGRARWSRSPAPTRAAERARLAEHGVIVRNIPGRPWLRASVGAWNDEDDLERLIGMLSRDRRHAPR